MSTPPLADKIRKTRKRAVEKALKEGYPPPGISAGGVKGALRVAGERLRYKRSTLTSWVMGEVDFLPDWSLYEPVKTVEVAPKPVVPQISASPESIRITKLEDENKRLRAELRGAHREQLDADSIRELIGNLAKADTKIPKWVPQVKPKKTGVEEVPMTIWSDWHYGETVDIDETAGVNEYNPAIARKRIRQLVESTIDLCRNHGPGNYPGVVVNLLGDFISGGLHPELVRTDAVGVMPAAIQVRDLLVWGLEQMADEFGKVFCPCASGNHGRNTPKPEYKGYLEHNFDWLIYQMLIRHFSDDKRISFLVPDANECYFRIYGHRFLAVHGDMLGARGGDGIIGSIGPIMRGEFKTRNQASATDRPYDFLLMGHYHQQLWLPRAIVANSIKGYDEYVKNSLRASPSEPSQPLWMVHPLHGITVKRDVLVSPHTKVGAEPTWLQWDGE